MISWTRKAWQAFVCTALALSNPLIAEADEVVMKPIKDLYNTSVLPKFKEEGQPAVLESHDVMEPRPPIGPGYPQQGGS